MLVVIYLVYPRQRKDNRPFIEYNSIEEMENNLQIKVLLPKYMPKVVISSEADESNHYASISYATFRRKKQTGYIIKQGKYELDDTNGYEGKFTNFYVQCKLKKMDTHQSRDKVLVESNDIIHGIVVNEVLIEEEQYTKKMNYWYKFKFEYDGYEYHVMSNIYSYYTEELLQEIRGELLRSVEDMLNI